MAVDEVVVRAQLKDEMSRPLRRISGEVERFERGVNRATGPGTQRNVAALSRNVSLLSTSVGHLAAQATKTSALTLGTLGVAATGFGLKTASSFEQSRIAFGTLLGDVETGTRLFSDLQRFNLQTPFELPALADATQQLVLYGASGQEALETVKTLSDVAASSGPRMQENLGRMTFALGQIRAAGVIRAEELNQLTDAGFPAMQALLELTGKTGPELRKSLESGLDPAIATRFLDAVETGQLQALTRFRGGAEAQAKTLGGVFSNLKDTVNTGLAAQTQPLADTLIGNMPALQASIDGLITTAMPGVTRLVSLLAEGAPGAITAFTPVLGQLTTSLADMVETVGPHMPQIVEVMTDLVGVLPELAEIGVQLVPVVGKMVDVFDAFLDLPFGHEAAAGLLVTLVGFNAVVLPLAGGITALAGAYRALAGGLTAAAAAGALDLGPDGRPRSKGGGKGGGLPPAVPLPPGGKGGRLARFGRFGATLIGTGLGIDAGMQIFSAPSGTGNDLRVLGETTAAGGLLGARFGPVGAGVGAAAGAAAGVGGTIGRRWAESGNARQWQRDREVLQQQVNVTVNSPNADVDIVRAVQRALAEHEASRGRRG
jgi:tape measure domain-containing protein